MTDEFRPSWIRWYNDADGAKIACVAGKFGDIPYGSVSKREFHAEGKPPHPVHGQYQWGFACSPSTRTIILDGDYTGQWDTTATGKLLGPWRDIATSIRELEDGTFKFHVLIEVPAELVHLWPKQLPARFGHIKSNGFSYIEGVHASGTEYKSTRRDRVTADEALMRSFLEDNGGHLHTDSGSARHDDYAIAAAGWRDADGDYPGYLGDAVLGDWAEGTRNDSLPERCGIIKAAGERGTGGMGTLFSELCAEYDIETGRGDADVYQAFAKSYPAYDKIDQLGQKAFGLDAATSAASQNGNSAEVAQAPDDQFAATVARYAAIDWDEAWKAQPEQVNWLYEPLLEAGTANALFARRGTGKSLITQEIVWKLAKAGRRVIVVDEENRVIDWVDRLKDMGADPGDMKNVKLFSFQRLPPLDTPEGGYHLEVLAFAHQAELIVLDTTTRLVQGRENDSDTFLQLYRCSISRLKQRGMTTLRLDHPGKDADRGTRGSSAKEDDVDTVWLLSEIVRESLFRLERTKSRQSRGGTSVYTVQRLRDPLRHVLSSAELPPVTGLVKQLDDLGVPREAGRPAAREALKTAGVKVKNAELEAAIKERKQLPGAVGGSGGSSDPSAEPERLPPAPHIGQGSRAAPAPVNLEKIPVPPMPPDRQALLDQLRPRG